MKYFKEMLYIILLSHSLFSCFMIERAIRDMDFFFFLGLLCLYIGLRFLMLFWGDFQKKAWLRFSLGLLCGVVILLA